MRTFVIEDEHHAEFQAEFASWDAAVAELRRRSALAWDRDPNRAPCSSWRTCGRAYVVLEYDVAGRVLRRVAALAIDASGHRWSLDPFAGIDELGAVSEDGG